MTKGYVYCVSNPSFKENLYKIGFTTKNLPSRIDSLYKTGVPTKFHVNFAKIVKNCRRTEHEIHVKLKSARVNPSREFFKCPLPKIKQIFEKVDGTWWGKSSMVSLPSILIPTKIFNLRSGMKTSGKMNSSKTIKKSAKRTQLGRRAKHLKINYKV